MTNKAGKTGNASGSLPASPTPIPPDAAGLRRQAEERLQGREKVPPSDAPRSDERLVHELQVHQIELEMQNEELQRTRAQAEALLAQYTDLYDFAPVGYLTLSEQGLILEANLKTAKLLGVTRRALIKQRISRFILEEDHDIYHRHRKQILESRSTSSGRAGEPQACELRMVKTDGTPFWARLEATAAQDADDAPVCRAVLSDITERRKAEDEQRHAKDSLETAHREIQSLLAREQLLARTDDLTGLYNRRCFFELATREFNAAVRYQRPLAILMFDVDNLKRVNDTFGHTVGDKVVMMVGQTAAAQIRAIDVLARYGGDEFVILLPQTNAQQALPIAERIHAGVASMRMEIDKSPLGVTLSIGIAEMWREPPDALVEIVAQRADKALYAAKAEGRNRTVTYCAETRGGAGQWAVISDRVISGQ
jgi:diguanylate cyclase (GGDEF)-like protein/PAS domain S-box-containing protein